jgi:hypothetical protein
VKEHHPISDEDRRIARRDASRRYRERKAFADFLCMGCGVCTFCNGDYYMVTKDLWNAVCGNPIGMLCIRCLENRLGRLLNRLDFIDAPVNLMAFESGSVALRAALRRSPDEPSSPYIQVAPTTPPFCEHLPRRRKTIAR